jgi:hypothetical protein
LRSSTNITATDLIAPVSTCYNEASSSEYNCFVSALRASEQLHQVLASIRTLSLDQVLNTTRQALHVVHGYSNCPLCTDFSRFPFYTILLRQSTECYLAFSQASDNQTGTNTIELQFGDFSVDGPVGRAVEAVISSEVRRITTSISGLGDILKPGGVRGSRETWDEATCVYQTSLIDTLKYDVANIRGKSFDTNGNG